MTLIILASLIALSFFVVFRIKAQNRKIQQAENEFWERERRANAVRRKSLEHLDYIAIPLEKLPTDTLCDDPDIADCLDLLKQLSTLRIVNFTGYSNTDLKLEYGAPSITELAEYDQNYTLLVRTLQKWADLLLEKGYAADAETVMEFAVAVRTDVSRTYYKLADIYAARIETEKVAALVDTAETLRSSNRELIVRTLRETYL